MLTPRDDSFQANKPRSSLCLVLAYLQFKRNKCQISLQLWENKCNYIMSCINHISQILPDQENVHHQHRLVKMNGTPFRVHFASGTLSEISEQFISTKHDLYSVHLNFKPSNSRGKCIKSEQTDVRYIHFLGLEQFL